MKPAFLDQFVSACCDSGTRTAGSEAGDGGVHASPTIHHQMRRFANVGFFCQRTFKRRETAIEQQLEIAELALAEEQRREGLCFGRKLGMARQIAGDQVLEDAAVRRVRHFWDAGRLTLDAC